MRDSAHAKLLELQRKIHSSLKDEARRLIGPLPKAIRKYETECMKDLRPKSLSSSISPISKGDLIREVRRAEVSLIADFHTFSQAQKTALRIARDAIRPGEDWAIGLEMISSQYQDALDRHQNGEITLAEFHRLIHYNDDWGFPWKNYDPLFQWARDHSVRLIALNRPRTLRTELHERDVWAAGIITDLMAAKPRLRMIVLYGELHVGRAHLPKQISLISKRYLGKGLRSISVHQNNDDLYWELAKRGREQRTDTLRLKKDVFCVFSSTPWSKLQSLVSWAEGGILDDEPELGTDYLSLVRAYGGAIADFFHLPAPDYGSLSVSTLEDVDQLSGENRWVAFHVLNGLRVYVPELQVAYLASPSQNAAAEIAAIHLATVRTHCFWSYWRNDEEFFRLVLLYAFGFLGSLILNPRRKCDLPADHLRRIRELAGTRRGAGSIELRARKLALSSLKHPGRRSPLLSRADGEVVMLGARFLGYMLGKRLHQALLKDQVHARLIKETCLARAHELPGEFEARYRKLTEAVSSPKMGASKADRI